MQWSGAALTDLWSVAACFSLQMSAEGKRITVKVSAEASHALSYPCVGGYDASLRRESKVHAERKGSPDASAPHNAQADDPMYINRPKVNGAKFL